MITKDAICDAALQLAEKKDVEKITVTNVVETCGITRQTFYYHFQDMFAVAEYAMNREVKRLVEESKDCKTIEEALYCYAENGLRKKKAITRIMNSRYAMVAVTELVKGLKQYFRWLAEFHVQSEFELSYTDANFFLEYHSWAISSIFLQWSRQPNLDLEECVRKVARILRGELHI